jgi:hypothetical protein
MLFFASKCEIKKKKKKKKKYKTLNRNNKKYIKKKKKKKKKRDLRYLVNSKYIYIYIKKNNSTIMLPTHFITTGLY